MIKLKKFYKNISEHGNDAMRFLLAFLVLMFGAVIALNINVRMATAGPGEPFGGLSYSITDCDCTGNFAIYFNDLTQPTPITLPLIYEPGVTILYDFGEILVPNRWILGTWQPVGSCRGLDKFCTDVPTAGTMYMVGTSR